MLNQVGATDPHDTAKPAPQVRSVLCRLATHPYSTFVLSWNWKAASLSMMMRAPIFFFSTLRSGWHAVSMAVLVEAIYSAAISGCYGSFAQRMRNARPLWLAGLLISVAMPALLLWLDYIVHRIAGTPNLKNGILAAGIFACLSSLFNWYLMRHGNLLVGEDAETFHSDLKKIPRRVVGFVAVVPICCYRAARSRRRSDLAAKA
jgi:hypothetical protein